MSIVAFIKAVFSKRKSTRNSFQQSTKCTESTTTSCQQLSSKDGANFEYKDGVRYQNEEDVSYILPNDYNELDRLHQQHWFFKFVLQRNFHAPIEASLREGIQVLDSGCGPGTWTLDMAEDYRESKFIGIDSSAIFPESIRPPNVDFVIANLTKTLPFPDDSFDYIYQRLLIMGLKSDDWYHALKELYRVLKPGGYIELVECDTDIHNAGPLTEQLHSTLIQMTTAGGMLPDIARQLNNRLAEAGFVTITLKKQSMKYNHTDRGGELFWDDYKSVFSNSRPVLAKFNPEWEDAEAFETFLNNCGNESKTRKTLGCTTHVYVARKPTTL